LRAANPEQRRRVCNRRQQLRVVIGSEGYRKDAKTRRTRELRLGLIGEAVEILKPQPGKRIGNLAATCPVKNSFSGVSWWEGFEILNRATAGNDAKDRGTEAAVPQGEDRQTRGIQ
jgi:hypothetical protein